MRESYFFSQSQATRQILIDFALRLDQALSVEHVVLSTIRTELHYKEGQTFFYTLDPDNFKVTIYDDLQSDKSPINGCTQLRKVIYEIRDESGVWHGPIGTTCIFKDILKLEKGLSEVNFIESSLLDGLTEIQQNKLLQEYGDDLRGYGAANGLHEQMITDEYMRTLSHDDPIRRHLQALLHQRAPFSREALKLLHQHAKKRRAADIQALLAHRATVERSRQAAAVADVPIDSGVALTRGRLIPVEVAPRDPNIRALARSLLDEYRFVWPLIVEQVDAELRGEAQRLSTMIDDPVEMSLALYKELQRITGDQLTVREAEERCGADKLFVSSRRRQELLGAWNRIEPRLSHVTAVQCRLWRRRLEKNTLMPFELSEINDAFRILEADHQRLMASEKDKRQKLSASQQYWRGWYSYLALYAGADDAALLSRVKTGRVAPTDQTRLLQLKMEAEQGRLAEIPQSRFLKSATLKGALRPELRGDFLWALQLGTLPSLLREEFERVVDQAGLDRQTLLPLQLPNLVREVLLQAWPYIVPLLGEDAAASRHALEKDCYTTEQIERLNQVSKERFSADVMDAEDRQILLANTEIWRRSCTGAEFEYAIDALNQQKYHLPFLARYREWVLAVRMHLDKEERQRTRFRERVALTFHGRLLARWSVLKPDKSRLLQQIDSAMLLVALPSICDEFAKESKITLEIENAVLNWLNENSPIPSH